MTLGAGIKDALLAADRVDSRSSLAGEKPEDGYWVSLREMTALREALRHRQVQAVLDDHAPSLVKPKRRSATGIKRDSADIMFSRMIRERSGYQCQRCGAQHEPNSSGLHCAHMFSRRIKATRLDPKNAAALCFGCHQYLDSHPNEKLAFFRELLGTVDFDALEARAHARRDRKVG